MKDTPKLGHKMQKKSWSKDEINPEYEEKKIAIVLIATVLIAILLGLLIWWLKNNLN